MIRLIASDMDGTLLDEYGNVPPETFELIHALREKGIHFVASSGRRYDTLRWMFEPVAHEIDYVASLGTQVYADDVVLDRVFDPPSPDVSIIKAAVCCDTRVKSMDMAMILERELGERFSFMPSGDTWIDVVPRGVNKATGLEQIRQYYGFKRDEILAFGDSMNDYAMLRYAGTAVVMENARYALKQIASRVIGSNTTQAVQAEMRKMLESLQ